jgi:amidase
MDKAELAYAGVAEQARLIAAGEVSSRELVELCLERIERYNPRLNAFRIVLAERARMEADQADARRKAGAAGERGGGADRPLLGVPIAVKDEFDVAGELTTFGTSAYGEPAREDSEIVKRMRAAGAIVIGKTLMPELGAFPWTESPTWGVTRNPWNLEHSPGGSSGGSAAAVAAGLVPAALAGDGGGSIRFPSAYCNMFGLKTQHGRVPLAPHLDAWHGLVVNGLLARSVRDTALLYDAIAEGPPDPGAPVVAQSSFTAALVQGGDGGGGATGATGADSTGGEPGRKLRIAVSSKLPPSPLTRLHADNRAALEETAELLRELGHEVRECEVDHGPLAPPLEFTAIYLRSVNEEAATFARPQNLERRIRALARLGGMLPPGAADWAVSRKAAYAARMNRPLADHDVLLTPVTPAPPPRIGACEGFGWLRTTAVAAATVAYAAPWNYTGQPACSVPAGFGEGGLPRSVQLIGRPSEEATLVALAAQIEAARPWTQDRPPGFE